MLRLSVSIIRLSTYIKKILTRQLFRLLDEKSLKQQCEKRSSNNVNALSTEEPAMRIL